MKMGKITVPWITCLSSMAVGESGHTPDTFTLDVICSATIQVRRTTNTIAVGPMHGLHIYHKTSELTEIAKEGEVEMSDNVKNSKVAHQWGEVGARAEFYSDTMRLNYT